MYFNHFILSQVKAIWLELVAIKSQAMGLDRH